MNFVRNLRLIGLAAMIAWPGFTPAQDVQVKSSDFAITTPGPSTVVNAAAHYVDEILAQTLASLELIAATPEARSGDWEGVRRYLLKFDTRLPAIHFYLRPDGSLYTRGGGLSRHNVRDRPYFEPLFAGNPVRGVPLLSRTTGRKATMLAQPVFEGGRVVGAVGASVFLDDLRLRLNRELALPAGYTWFVLDADGTTMLDRDSEYILMSVFEQGSESMQHAVREAMRQEAGTTQYALGGLRHAHFRKLPTMGWWMFLARTDAPAIDVPQRHAEALQDVTTQLQSALEAIDTALSATIVQAIPAREDVDLRPWLDTLARAHPGVVNAAFIDRDGMLAQIAPEDYVAAEGADLTHQAHVRNMLAAPGPIFGAGFKAVEGGLAANLIRPLFDDRQQFAGAISALLQPTRLIRNLEREIGADQEFWIMQPDGLILHDADEDEIGLNLFTDPLYADYPNLIALGHEIAASPEGIGGYVFPAAGGGVEIVKHAVWRTVRLHGQEWRVVLAYRAFPARD